MTSMTSPSPPSWQRLGATLSHLQHDRSGGRGTTAPGRRSGGAAAAAAAGHTTLRTSDHLERLDRDGVTVVEGVYSPAQMDEFRAALTEACGEVAAALPTLEWSEMRYKQHFVDLPSFCVGKALYQGKRSHWRHWHAR